MIYLKYFRITHNFKNNMNNIVIHFKHDVYSLLVYNHDFIVRLKCLAIENIYF
jgi:hypothetical protein